MSAFESVKFITPVRLVSVNKIDRSKDGKSELIFAKLADPLTFESRELIVTRNCVLPPVGSDGLPIITIGEFNGRSSHALSGFEVVSK